MSEGGRVNLPTNLSLDEPQGTYRSRLRQTSYPHSRQTWHFDPLITSICTGQRCDMADERRTRPLSSHNRDKMRAATTPANLQNQPKAPVRQSTILRAPSCRHPTNKAINRVGRLAQIVAHRTSWRSCVSAGGGTVVTRTSVHKSDSADMRRVSSTCSAAHLTSSSWSAPDKVGSTRNTRRTSQRHHKHEQHPTNTRTVSRDCFYWWRIQAITSSAKKA